MTFDENLEWHESRAVQLVISAAAPRGWDYLLYEGVSPVDGRLSRGDEYFYFDGKSRTEPNRTSANVVINDSVLGGWNEMDRPVLIVADDGMCGWWDQGLSDKLIWHSLGGYWTLDTVNPIFGLGLHLVDVLR